MGEEAQEQREGLVARVGGGDAVPRRQPPRQAVQHERPRARELRVELLDDARPEGADGRAAPLEAREEARRVVAYRARR